MVFVECDWPREKRRRKKALAGSPPRKDKKKTPGSPIDAPTMWKILALVPHKESGKKEVTFLDLPASDEKKKAARKEGKGVARSPGQKKRERTSSLSECISACHT